MAVFLTVTARAQSPDDDVAHGKKLYGGHCALCHGQTGTGGKGPSLAQPTLGRAPDDTRLIEVIRSGIPGTEMPGSWQLTPHEATQVAAFVRSLGRVPRVPLPGDAARGKTLYESKGACRACHIIRGEGSSYGPELTEIGLRRSADYLREALLQPGASVPNGFLMVTVTTREGKASPGKTIRGIRVAEDSFTIQLRDSGNQFHSFRKSALANLKQEFHTSPMPSYETKFSAAELDDVIAYLASLRGAS